MKINLFFYFILITISNINSEECEIDNPIIKDSECQMIYCPNSQYKDNTCVISNSIIKTQWLNNIILISESPSLYINQLINSNGDLIIMSNKYSSRIFYGIKSNGRPFFYSAENNNFFYKKILYLDKPLYKLDFEVINLIINNTEYYLSVCSEGFVELLDLNNDKIIYKKTSEFLGRSHYNQRFYLEKSSLENEFLYIFTSEIQDNFYIFLKQIKINSINLEDIEGNETCVNKVESSNRENIISCSRNNKIYLFCLFKQFTFFYYNYKIIHNFSSYEVIFKDSSFYSPSFINEEYLFYKNINLNENNIISCFFKKVVNEEEELDFLIIFIYNNDEINENISQSFNAKLKKYHLIQSPSSCDIIRINDNKFVFIGSTSNKQNLIIYLFDYYNDNSNEYLMARIYYISLTLYNLEYNNVIRCFNFNNIIGITFSAYESNNENDSSTFLLLFGFINSTDPIAMKNIFEKEEIYNLKLSDYINDTLIENNLFGNELIGIKILYLFDFNKYGISIISANKKSQITINDILEVNDIIQFKVISNQGALFGNYYFEFAGVMQEPSTYEKMKKYTKSIHFFKAGDYFDDEITDEYSECYQPLTYIGKSSFFNYSIESCYKTCLECNNILGDSTYHHCTNCNEKFYYNHNNRKKCLESCDNSNGYYLLENTKTCINEKPSINYYLDEESEIKVFKKCYNNCLSCSKGPNLIDNNMNCDSCDEINGFFFIENTKNC